MQTVYKNENPPFLLLPFIKVRKQVFLSLSPKHHLRVSIPPSDATASLKTIFAQLAYLWQRPRVSPSPWLGRSLIHVLPV